MIIKNKIFKISKDPDYKIRNYTKNKIRITSNQKIIKKSSR
jgi:hypothetical protein